MKDILVLYHGGKCAEGFGAAYAAWVKFKDSADYIAVNYGEEPPDVTNKEVYIVDFSYPLQTLVDMKYKSKSIFVIDHHESAVDNLLKKKEVVGLICDQLKAETHNRNIDYIKRDVWLNMEQSGCCMAWDYFHPGIPAPYGLLLIQDRDLWLFKDNNTKAFNAALRAFIKFDFFKWHEIMSSNTLTLDLIERGEDVLTVFDKDIADLSAKAYRYTLNGIECLACNAPAKYASELGNVLAKKSNYGIIYSFDGQRKEWQYSLRSIGDFSVKDIAVLFGGGGHKNAAGFSTKELIL